MLRSLPCALAAGMALLLGGGAGHAQGLRYGAPAVIDLRGDPAPGMRLSSRADRSWRRVARPNRGVVPVDFVGRQRDDGAVGYATTGNGYGSTGYGYGGDFSGAYPSGVSAERSYDAPASRVWAAGYRSRPFFGAANLGYGGRGGFVPALPPGGGLPVYVPGAFGPGPRIVTIPGGGRLD